MRYRITAYERRLTRRTMMECRSCGNSSPRALRILTFTRSSQVQYLVLVLGIVSHEARGVGGRGCKKKKNENRGETTSTTTKVPICHGRNDDGITHLHHQQHQTPPLVVLLLRHDATTTHRHATMRSRRRRRGHLRVRYTPSSKRHPYRVRTTPRTAFENMYLFGIK